MKHSIFLIVGPSGSGKTTITDFLEQKYGHHRVRNYTTRKRRTNEPADTYKFVDPYEFNKYPDMTNVTLYHHNSYGARLADLLNVDLYIVDPSGVDYMREHHNDKFCIHAVKLNAPTKVCAERMKARGDSDSAILSRLKNDADVFNLPNDFFDTIIENDNIEQTAETLHRYMVNCTRHDREIQDFLFLKSMYKKHQNETGRIRENPDGTYDLLIGNDIIVTSCNNDIPHTSSNLMQTMMDKEFHIQPYTANNRLVNFTVKITDGVDPIFMADTYNHHDARNIASILKSMEETNRV